MYRRNIRRLSDRYKSRRRVSGQSTERYSAQWMVYSAHVWTSSSTILEDNDCRSQSSSRILCITHIPVGKGWDHNAIINAGTAVRDNDAKCHKLLNGWTETSKISLADKHRRLNKTQMSKNPMKDKLPETKLSPNNRMGQFVFFFFVGKEWFHLSPDF
ncbi:hypothetical protein CEXT_663311 [Caerostris extrusa]|uniref:Uncharacterized protein n=1 Tax=Caerostris extrusa TaxID=172846 RepID=A0AAV4T900_CAEEX|nr:hypothetical protein CEXT_663311 [Caerostris extrusa]